MKSGTPLYTHGNAHRLNSVHLHTCCQTVEAGNITVLNITSRVTLLCVFLPHAESHSCVGLLTSFLVSHIVWRTKNAEFALFPFSLLGSNESRFVSHSPFCVYRKQTAPSSASAENIAETNQLHALPFTNELSLYSSGSQLVWLPKLAEHSQLLK